MNRLMLRLLATVLVAAALQTSVAGDTSGVISESALFRYPETNGATLDSADVIGRVERALLRYAPSCAAHDEEAMAEIFTGFAVIAYASDSPGRFIASPAIIAHRCWAAGALAGQFLRESPIWIYPTSDPNDVFVQYSVVIEKDGAQRTVQDIALVEMAGDRVAQIRDYMSMGDLEP